MSINNYELAKRQMNQYQNMMHFVGPRPEYLISKAEETLELEFPASYRNFLIDFGAGGFGSEGILGIVNEDFFDSGDPDGIWFTIQQRKIGLPHHYIVIYDVGDGDIFCLDTTSNDEAPVVCYQPGYPIEQQRKEIVAPDFGTFILNLVNVQIQRSSELFRKKI